VRLAVENRLLPTSWVAFIAPALGISGRVFQERLRFLISETRVAILPVVLLFPAVSSAICYSGGAQSLLVLIEAGSCHDKESMAYENPT
jgi:hypothetical protein